jgi:uncharacterized protein
MTTEHYPQPYIHTRKGRFYLDNPTFDADSIGHALGMLCRFNGNTRVFYSVAEHSVLVSELMRKVVGGDPFEGLMHDAAEAYLSDIPTPFKRLLPDWQKFEQQVEEPLRMWAGLPRLKTHECERADKLALFMESYMLIPEHGMDFLDPLGMRTMAHELLDSGKWNLRCWEPITAGYMWQQHYHSMRSKYAA